ncbi:FecR family protein [Phenylobacterium terrae]|uniref:FecR family protein n=1 Tax=Phenylobacterium terrae TaxID=2665495 RepID=A0ABW4N693_9CAUL
MGDARRETDRARHEAADWFTRLSQPSVTTDALREFRAWRSAPENRAAYEKVERVWGAAGALAGDPEVMALGQRSSRRRQRSRRSGMTGWTWVAPAAAALALAIAAFIAWNVRATVYESGVGEQRVVRLEDGSVLRLNTDSRAVIRFGDEERRIQLTRGEALFEVAHERARPFIVEAGGAEVRALGTRFDVRRTAEGVDVVLLQGVVQVQSGDDASVTLKPNQRVAVAGAQIRPVTTADVSRLTSWTDGRLVFDETPLAEAVAEVNRYSARKVRLEAAGMQGSAVSGAFRTGDAEAFAAAVAAIFDLQVAEGRGGVLILKRAVPDGA